MGLKRSNSNDGYGDVFNRTVCATADKLGISLPDAERIVKEELGKEIGDKDIEEYLSMTLKSQEEKRLRALLSRNLGRVKNPEKALVLTSILFEINQIKTDEVWGQNKLEEIFISGLKGEKINFITMLCLINKFDYRGGYTAVPELDSYLDNPRLEAIPLILREILTIMDFFAFYRIDTSLTIYVADTDYTEIGQYGPINETNLLNIQIYLENLRKHLSIEKAKVVAISELTNDNLLYREVKSRVLENVEGFKDPDFEREWYQKFEDALEKISESQAKKKLFPTKEIRKKSLEITRNIWAVNAAQGAVLADLGPNTILISTERRERDTNYVIDKVSRKNFPPVLYILKATEMWNRKLTGKVD